MSGVMRDDVVEVRVAHGPTWLWSAQRAAGALSLEGCADTNSASAAVCLQTGVRKVFSLLLRRTVAGSDVVMLEGECGRGPRGLDLSTCAHTKCRAELVCGRAQTDTRTRGQQGEKGEAAWGGKALLHAGTGWSARACSVVAAHATELSHAIDPPVQLMHTHCTPAVLCSPCFRSPGSTLLKSLQQPAPHAASRWPAPMYTPTRGSRATFTRYSLLGWLRPCLTSALLHDALHLPFFLAFRRGSALEADEKLRRPARDLAIAAVLDFTSPASRRETQDGYSAGRELQLVRSRRHHSRDEKMAQCTYSSASSCGPCPSAQVLGRQQHLVSDLQSPRTTVKV